MKNKNCCLMFLCQMESEQQFYLGATMIFNISKPPINRGELRVNNKCVPPYTLLSLFSAYITFCIYSKLKEPLYLNI